MADYVVTVLTVAAGTGLLVALGAGLMASIRNRRKRREPEHEQTLIF